MKTLLKEYCKLNNLSIEDMTGDSRTNDLPQHRHIYAYCMQKAFPSLRRWQIARILNKGQVYYGIKEITELLTPIKKRGRILPDPPSIRVTKTRINLFLNICSKYKWTDLEIPQK